jgi:lipooligosaccharide transport system permease protein
VKFSNVGTTFQDMITLPRFGSGVWSVWQRNYLYFRYTIAASLFWILLEPCMYLLAIGFGVGSLIQEVEGQPYIQFFYPALLATSGMMVAFFEAAYGSYTKLSRQKTYATILMTPISAGEIVIGEIFWAATKGFFSVIAVVVVTVLFGLVKTWLIIPAMIILLVQCWIFAALGMYFAATAKNYDSFIYAQSGLIIPMSLFSGTYFPLSQMPIFIQYVAYLFPLTHSTMAVRSLMHGRIDSLFYLNVVILFLMAILMTNLASSKMEKKILI